MVIGDIAREFLIGGGEWLIKILRSLHLERESFGEGTSAAAEVKKRQSRRIKKPKVESQR